MVFLIVKFKLVINNFFHFLNNSRDMSLILCMEKQLVNFYAPFPIISNNVVFTYTNRGKFRISRLRFTGHVLNGRFKKLSHFYNFSHMYIREKSLKRSLQKIYFSLLYLKNFFRLFSFACFLFLFLLDRVVISEKKYI